MFHVLGREARRLIEVVEGRDPGHPDGGCGVVPRVLPGCQLVRAIAAHAHAARALLEQGNQLVGAPPGQPGFGPGVVVATMPPGLGAAVDIARPADRATALEPDAPRVGVAGVVAPVVRAPEPGRVEEIGGPGRIAFGTEVGPRLQQENRTTGLGQASRHDVTRRPASHDDVLRLGRKHRRHDEASSTRCSHQATTSAEFTSASRWRYSIASSAASCARSLEPPTQSATTRTR